MMHHHTMTGLAVLSLAASTGLANAGDPDDFEHLPNEIVLTGTVRDFHARGDGGHTDFEWRPSAGYGHYVGMVAPELDDDGKPVYASSGFKIASQWKDSSGRAIAPPMPHLPSLEGDNAGGMSSEQGGSSHSAEAFAQWFRDVPGINASMPLNITLVRNEGTNQYTFDDREDSFFQNLGGFFAINNELFGNYRSTGKNFHFTFELETEFVYQADAGQTFTFTGDDDVWVFVDGKCVIDIGGVHSRVAQTIDLDRLAWLEDGQTYELKFFFAERHTTQSNFRIETTLTLRSVNLPTTTALSD